MTRKFPFLERDNHVRRNVTNPQPSFITEFARIHKYIWTLGKHSALPFRSRISLFSFFINFHSMIVEYTEERRMK